MNRQTILYVLASALGLLAAYSMTKLPLMLKDQHARQQAVVGEIVPLHPQKKVEWCKKDKDCKAMLQTLYHEARGESDEGVKAVAQVIINRAAHPVRWKDTVHGVIHEPWQFSYLWDGSVNRGMKDNSQVRRMAIISYDAINGTIDTPVKNAVFYHTRYIKKPLWARNNCVVTTIGSHVFYKGRSENGECK